MLKLYLFNNQIKEERNKREIKLRDFEVFEKISQYDLESIELNYLKKLYMLHPKVSFFRRWIQNKRSSKIFLNVQRTLALYCIGYKRSKAAILMGQITPTQWKIYSKIYTNFLRLSRGQIWPRTRCIRVVCLMTNSLSGRYSCTVARRPIYGS